VDWVLPPVLAVSPVVWAKSTVAVDRTPGPAFAIWLMVVGSVPGVTWTCQSTATPRTARSVMVALEWARNDPSEASSATATATPTAAAPRRAGRRRRRPPSQVPITLARPSWWQR